METIEAVVVGSGLTGLLLAAELASDPAFVETARRGPVASTLSGCRRSRPSVRMPTRS
ncbi:hypothetical protein [Streptomyces sp. SID12501]|uniref:hypothetical protein n=1 Tax=Streptomyces sp. SID12501 TaxID=2706042 RepID=UPI001EF227BE|nr:hypothetical protein [Streptomyces sp. SID12501]